MPGKKKTTARKAKQEVTQRRFRIDDGIQRRVVKKFHLPSRTIQSEAAECNINRIMSRYVRTGQAPEQKYTYGVQPSQSFYEAQTVLAEAKTEYENLPDDKKNGFENFIDQIINPEPEDKGSETAEIQHPADSEAQADGEGEAVASE